MKYLFIIGWLAVGVFNAQAQSIVIGLDQPDFLEANAGVDTLVCKTHSVILGSDQTAKGGTGDYVYLWYPNIFLDDFTSPNPICTAEETTTYILTTIDASGCTATSYVTVAIDPCLGVNSLNYSQNIGIYPNPIHDNFTISGLTISHAELKIRIINPLGQTLYTSDLSYSTGSEIRIQPDVKFEPGLYFVQIEVNGEAIRRAIQII